MCRLDYLGGIEEFEADVFRSFVQIANTVEMENRLLWCLKE
jgi:hypothetical protein